MLLLFYLNAFHLSNAAMIDAFVSKDIKEFENCPLVLGPSVNITHTEAYDSITICWRFMTTAYPHLSCGESSYPIVSKKFEWRIYQPISGMSVEGKQAGWLGFSLEETDEGKGTQIHWRSILYEDQLEIYEWQSVCLSHSKQTKTTLLFHNGKKQFDYLVDEEHTVIPRDFLSKVTINKAARGSFSDLQVYSQPMDEDALRKWTTCKYNQPGDVFEWDINKFNLTHDERIVSAIEKVDTDLFCKSESSGQKEIHIFGDRRIDPISNVKGTVLCKRLNARILMLPATKKDMKALGNYLLSYANKTNLSTGTYWCPNCAWIGGLSDISESYGKPHWSPPMGLYDMKHPETGQPLINEENRKSIHREGHSYEILENVCFVVAVRIGEDPMLHFQKCKRKLIGRVMCEFESKPLIRIKGLCQQSPIDRDFVLIEPKLGEGNSFMNFSCVYVII